MSAFAVAAFAIYLPALSGGFVSDDIGYIVSNQYVQELSAENLVAILHPFGRPTQLTVNYAPVHLILHAVEWQLFGYQNFVGYHLVNVAIHVVASVLLVALFVSSGIPQTAAIVLGALFLLHPANVEAVAWIFQLKTSLALALSLGALLVLRSRPRLSLALFALALLTKITAAFALPVAAVTLWTRGSLRRRDWLWLGAWTGVLGLCMIASIAAFTSAGATAWQQATEIGDRVRSSFAIGGRYLVMATTSYGVSAFHEPPPAKSLADPWWLAGLLLLGLLAWRWIVSLRRHSQEAAYWTWAAASFAQVSQVIPFLYPMADRYLYFILPGLLGGSYFLVREALAIAEGRLARGNAVAARSRLARGALVAGALLAVLFAWHSATRTPIWRSAILVDLDAARNYPDGITAHFMRARTAAQRGDVDAAVAALQRLADRNYYLFQFVEADAGLRPLHGRPQFDRVMREIANNFIVTAKRKRKLGQEELHMLAFPYPWRGEEAEALHTLRRAVELEGPLDQTIREQLAVLEARRSP